MNIDSFSDEQMLNLVNSTIEDSGNNIDSFTGGAVQVTSAYNNKITTYKVMLFFGYDKNKNPITYIEEIKEEYYFIWSEAIMTKVHSLKVKNMGSDLNKMNERMNRNKEVRNEGSTNTLTPSTLPIPTTSIPTTSIPIRKPKNFFYPKEFEDIWKINKGGDKWSGYRSYSKIKDEYPISVISEALEVEAKKTIGRRHTSTVLNGDIEDLILQKDTILKQQKTFNQPSQSNQIIDDFFSEQDVEVIDAN